MPKVVKRSAKSKAKADVNWDEFPNTVRQFLGCKKQATFLDERIGTLKKEINAVVDDYGEPDESGHIRLELDDEIDGIGSLKRERRVSKRLNEDRATEVLKKKKLYSKCTRTVVVLDEDAIAQATFEGKLSGEEFDSMFEESITWALIPQKAS